MEVAMRVETRSVLPHDRVLHVNVDDVIVYLNNNPDSRVVDQLYDFGKLLLDQIRGLRDSYDSKLTSCLGWGTAVLAILLIGIKEWIGKGPSGVLASAGMILTFVSVLAATAGLWSRAGWKWPSEKDWFPADYLDWPEAVRRHHLVTMLEAHQSYSQRTQQKGYALMISEYLLAASAVLLGISAFIKQLS
jgi:hypothetical protein